MFLSPIIIRPVFITNHTATIADDAFCCHVCALTDVLDGAVRGGGRGRGQPLQWDQGGENGSNLLRHIVEGRGGEERHPRWHRIQKAQLRLALCRASGSKRGRTGQGATSREASSRGAKSTLKSKRSGDHAPSARAVDELIGAALDGAAMRQVQRRTESAEARRGARGLI
eukprot:353059-Chlamydomonas_euryale.AAC.1